MGCGSSRPKADVSQLLGRFTEGSGERDAPVHALRKALHLIAADCNASYASLTVLSADHAHFMTVGAVGSCSAAVSLPVLAALLPANCSSLEPALKGDVGTMPIGGAGSRDSGSGGIVSWRAPGAGGVPAGAPPPEDWRPLAKAGLRAIHGVCIRGGLKEQLLGMLNVGYTNPEDQELKGAIFQTYLALVGATVSAVAKDAALQHYLALSRELQAAQSLDAAAHSALQRSRAVLKGRGPGAGGGAGAHLWLRLALVSSDKSAAMLFDDLTQAAAVRGHRRPAATNSFSGSFTLVQRIQAAGGLLRTNIPMRSTILRIALTNKKQVLIPDVQKLINQLGAVNTDLFASRHVRPPTSVLLLPLRASGHGIYGGIYCLSDVQTEFTDITAHLKEVADLVGSSLFRCLSGDLKAEYEDVLALTADAILSPDALDGSGHAADGAAASPRGAPTPPSKDSCGAAAGALNSSGGRTPRVSGGASAPAARGGGSGFSTGPGRDCVGGGGGATADAYELGSTVSTTGGSVVSAGCGSFSAPANTAGRSFVARQGASSTGALVTGITEKLNQRRLEAAMQDTEGGDLRDLQLTAQIGEGGFARVFRGLWRGQVVAVKVVASGGPGNERSVMKNAHEIAILSALSHPNILQAYTCLTDMRVRDVIASCVRHPSEAARAELEACLTAGGSNSCGAEQDANCHIEVVEYCDLGNLTHAIRNNAFRLPPAADFECASIDALPGLSPHNRAPTPAAAAAAGCPQPPPALEAPAELHSPGHGARPEGREARDREREQREAQEALRVNLTTLLLTLLEVAGGMAYLHRMGVVHCDLKPANVLLKSSSVDRRGFTAKISDFGLSRVEDDDSCATFPFNSCGTAAYVAPEALVTSKKVNSSVDVYAFGIIMWELLTGQRPYGNMQQQQASAAATDTASVGKQAPWRGGGGRAAGPAPNLPSRHPACL
ncbi:Serine/threonine-protein kinase ppk16 [Monoraphidium neglectum]|uniref:Serine/threonine-protein kinase ppk16 n=1 Tax=Monoraphidium neglectum TaxID=145388 RepID=A0A0D2MK17_9CHLO|nr:Serine/threonine-protein kinase ppk16 [Monoraphidium neglectum]KIZ00957.1 Serine/threonine-protein kinase ppk16 [Monoraphidium neglectum]|eukprot:XP_013899976.1 Serine/threonine-protein kinase ppk16 [Monoraphidium neglectum]